MSEQEKKNKKTAALLSVLVHGLLLLAFLFMLAWKEPNPPLPEYGIQLNFGLDNVGSGDIQPEIEANESESTEEAAPEEIPTESTETPEVTDIEEVKDVTVPIVEETTTNTMDSPDKVAKEVVKEDVKPVVKDKPKEEKKETTKPVEKKEVVKPEVGAKGKEGESTNKEAANQGDNLNKVGDKGDEKGTLDARALYGQPGGGDGKPGLQIIGWMWDEVPNKRDQSSENGQVIIDFLIDSDGYVIKTTIIQTGVSMSVAKFYEDQLRHITFSKTSSGVVTSATTKGTVTFVIKSK
jgi:periplasmic protein TonB